MAAIEMPATKYWGKVSVRSEDEDVDVDRGVLLHRELEVGGIYTLLIDNSYEMDVVLIGLLAGRSLLSTFHGNKFSAGDPVAAPLRSTW